MDSCCAGPTLTPRRIWQMLKTTQSISPSSHLMIRMTNIILYLRLVWRGYASIIESSCKINCIPNHNIMFHYGMWPRSHSNDWKGWQTRCYFPWLGLEGDVRVMREARLVRRHHKHSSNDPANFPTNSQTDKFLHLPHGSSSPLPACDIKTPFYSVFFENTKEYFLWQVFREM